MRTVQRRYEDALHAIEHEGKPYVRGVYIKVTEKSLIMSGSTGEAVLITSQLVLFLAMRIG